MTSPAAATAHVYLWMSLSLSAGKNTITSAPKKGTAISAKSRTLSMLLTRTPHAHTPGQGPSRDAVVGVRPPCAPCVP